MHFLRKLETLISFGFLMINAERFTVASESEEILQEIQKDYNDCGKRNIFCYGDTEGCVEKRDCALLAIVDWDYRDLPSITVSHRCLKEDGKKFLSAIAFEIPKSIHVSNERFIQSSGCDSRRMDYRVYQLWDGEKCKLSQGNPKREHYYFKTGDEENNCLNYNPPLGPGKHEISYYIGVAVTSAGITSFTRESPQSAQQDFFRPLLNTYKHETVDKHFYITERDKILPTLDPIHYRNAASGILHSWFTFILLAFVIISNQCWS